MPLVQRKEYHLTLAKKTDNPVEVSELINAVYGSKLSNFRLENDSHVAKIIDVVSYWRTLMGCIKDVSPTQLRVEAQFLISEYPDTTVEDVRLAMNYCIKQKLDINLPYVINFSTLFMGQVLNAYQNYKRQQINKIGEQVTEPPLLEYKPTPAQKAEDMKDIIRQCNEHIKQGCKERFFFKIVYDFLRRTNRLVITDDLARKGKEYCDKRIATFIPTTSGTLKSLLPGANADAKKQKEAAIKQYKIDFCLIWFFENNKLEDVIKSITEKDYQDGKK